MKHFELLKSNNKKFLYILALAIFIAFSGLVFWFIGRPMLRFVETPELFRKWVEAHGIWGELSFIGMMVLQVIIAVIPGEPLELGAGYAFGAIEGTILCVIGASIGSVIVFALVRKFGVPLVEVFFPKEKLKKLKFLKYSRKRDLLIFIITFIPGTPKDIIAYFVGLTDIKVSTWFIICIIGRIPSIVTSTASGNAIGKESYILAVVLVAVTLAVSVIGLLIYKKICKHHN